MQSTDCINISGTGTPTSPFLIEPSIDPSSDNQLVCGESGLYVPATIVEAGDGVAVTGDGSTATPYTVDLLLDPDELNLLSKSEDGLLALARLNIEAGQTYLGGTPPDNTSFILKGGINGATTDTNGDFYLTFPSAFPNGLVTVVPIIGSVPTVNVNLAIDQTVVSLNAVRVNAKQSGSGAVISGGNLLVAWLALGW